MSTCRVCLLLVLGVLSNYEHCTGRHKITESFRSLEYNRRFPPALAGLQGGHRFTGPGFPRTGAWSGRIGQCRTRSCSGGGRSHSGNVSKTWRIGKVSNCFLLFCCCCFLCVCVCVHFRCCQVIITFKGLLCTLPQSNSPPLVPFPFFSPQHILCHESRSHGFVT